MTGLLPEGYRDSLPPHADLAARLEGDVLRVAHAHGYERVEPPLAEYEEALARRLKAARARDAVRFVDPVSQLTLAIRPDITAQVGRIAATRMGHHPRPVRLSYAGTVLRLRASDLHPERAMRQIGVELIGLDSVAAAAEVVGVAVEALTASGLTDLSVDFTLPDLLQVLVTSDDRRRDALACALDGKDAGAVAAIDPAYLPLVAAAGPLGEAIERLRAFDTAGVLATRLDGLSAIAAQLPAGVRLTLDPTERHGFEYQSWFGFSIFAGGALAEIGRGGSYTVMHDGGAEEPAVGVSLYADRILPVIGGTIERRRLFLPHGTSREAGAALRAEGWVTVAALTEDDTPAAQLCTHRLTADGPVAV